MNEILLRPIRQAASDRARRSSRAWAARSQQGALRGNIARSSAHAYTTTKAGRSFHRCGWRHTKAGTPARRRLSPADRAGKPRPQLPVRADPAAADPHQLAHARRQVHVERRVVEDPALFGRKVKAGELVVGDDRREAVPPAPPVGAHRVQPGADDLVADIRQPRPDPCVRARRVGARDGHRPGRAEQDAVIPRERPGDRRQRARARAPRPRPGRDDHRGGRPRRRR